MSLNLEGFQNDFRQGSRITEDIRLTEEVLERLGFASSSKTILERLLDRRFATWGCLLKIESKDEAIEIVGDRDSGSALWASIQDYLKSRTTPASILDDSVKRVTNLKGYLANCLTAIIRDDTDKFLAELPSGVWEGKDVMKFKHPRHLNFDNILFVRECYRGLYPTILETVRVGDKCVVTGTSGIGISFFGLYSAKRFLEERLTVIHIDRGWDWANLYLPQTPSDRVRKVLADYCERQPEGPWAGRFDGSPLTLSLESRVLYGALTRLVGDVVVIVDPSADLGPSNWLTPNCGMLVVTNPIQEQKDTFKESGCVMTYYLPVWTEAELKDLLEKRNGAPLSEEEAQQLAYRVKRFGGVPQIVARLNHGHGTMVAAASKATKLVIRSLNALNLSAILDARVMDPRQSGRIIHLVPTADFELSGKKFASEKIESEIIVQCYERSRHDLFVMMKSASTLQEYASTLGKVYEPLWSLAIQMGGEFKVARLKDKPARNCSNALYERETSRKVTVPATASRYAAKQDLSDITTLWEETLLEGAKGLYFHFLMSNVPLVDSICVVDGETGMKIFGVESPIPDLPQPNAEASEQAEEQLVSQVGRLSKKPRMTPLTEPSAATTPVGGGKGASAAASKAKASMADKGKKAAAIAAASSSSAGSSAAFVASTEATSATPTSSSSASAVSTTCISATGASAQSKRPPCVMLNQMTLDPEHDFDWNGLKKLIELVGRLSPPGTSVHLCWVTIESGKDTSQFHFRYPSGGNPDFMKKLPQWLFLIPDEALVQYTKS